MTSQKTKMPKTGSQRQADRRARLSADGLFKRRDFWVHPEDEPALRKLEERFRTRQLLEREAREYRRRAIDAAKDASELGVELMEEWETKSDDRIN